MIIFLQAIPILNIIKTFLKKTICGEQWKTDTVH